MKLDTYLIPSTNSKCIKGLRVRPNCKTPRRKHERASRHWICQCYLWIWHQKHKQPKKNRQHRWHETQKWLHIKGENQWGRQATHEKYLQITYLLRSECPEHVRNSYNSTTTTKYLGTKDEILLKQRYTGDHKNLRDAQCHQPSEMPVKPQRDVTAQPRDWPSSKQNRNIGENVERLELCALVLGMWMVQLLWKSYKCSSKN